MTRTRTRTILLCIALAAFLIVGCVDLDIDRDEWQNDVLERQRQPGQPGPETPVAERTGK